MTGNSMRIYPQLTCLAGAYFHQDHDLGAPTPAGIIASFADASTVDDDLRRWGETQVQVAAQVMPVAERIERSAVFDMPDLTTMATAATNDWMSAAHPGLVLTLPEV